MDEFTLIYKNQLRQLIYLMHKSSNEQGENIQGVEESKSFPQEPNLDVLFQVQDKPVPLTRRSRFEKIKGKTVKFSQQGVQLQTGVVQPPMKKHQEKSTRQTPPIQCKKVIEQKLPTQHPSHHDPEPPTAPETSSSHQHSSKDTKPQKYTTHQFGQQIIQQQQNHSVINYSLLDLLRSYQNNTNDTLSQSKNNTFSTENKAFSKKEERRLDVQREVVVSEKKSNTDSSCVVKSMSSWKQSEKNQSQTYSDKTENQSKNKPKQQSIQQVKFFSKARSQKDSLNKLQKQMSEMKTQLQKLSQKVQHLSRENDQVKIENQTLNDQRKITNAEYQKIMQEMEQLRKEKQQLKKQIDELKSTPPQQLPPINPNPQQEQNRQQEIKEKNLPMNIPQIDFTNHNKQTIAQEPGQRKEEKVKEKQKQKKKKKKNDEKKKDDEKLGWKEILKAFVS